MYYLNDDGESYTKCQIAPLYTGYVAFAFVNIRIYRQGTQKRAWTSCRITD
jgi:hypothetical protein